MRKTSEIQAELSGITDENERNKYFENLVKEFDKDDKNNERKYFRTERRIDFDITNTDETCEVEDYNVNIHNKLTEICKRNEMNTDSLFSGAENLHLIITDRGLSGIIKSLKHTHKTILYYKCILGYKNSEIAKIKSVSDRYIRKVYNQIMDNIREKYAQHIRYKLEMETDEETKEIAREKDIYTTKAERDFLYRYENNLDEN